MYRQPFNFMTQESIKLQGQNVYEVAFKSSGNAYKAGTPQAVAGETFSRYTYNGAMFTIADSNPFNTDYKAGNVKSIKLNPKTYTVTVKDAEGKETQETREGYEFDTHINKAQWKSLQDDKVADAEVDYKVSRFKQLETAPLTDDIIAQLQNA